MNGSNQHPMNRRRIILYSHDGMGIGHIRRNLLLAQALSESGRNDVLLVAGVVEAGAFAMPANVDCLTLPSLRKSGNGSYESRRLGLPTDDIVNLRSGAIASAIEAFKPDAVVVDKVPRGVAGELMPALRSLRARNNAKLILGLREVLDDAATVRCEWDREQNWDLVDSFYDAIWIYGDQRVFDTASEYSFPEEWNHRTTYTGYIERVAATPQPDDELPTKPYALCYVGGGEDGAPLARAFAAAPLPVNMRGVIIAGPFMPSADRAKLHEIAANRDDLQVLNFVPDPLPLLAGADRVVAMGGYNSVSEVVCARKPSLIVPRVAPRQEQWIRACRLGELGLIDVLHPDDLSATRISRWLSEPATVPTPSLTIDFGGLSRLPQLLDDLLADKRKVAVDLPLKRKGHAVG